MFQTIVAATDGSEHARKAIALASELAEKYQAKLILVHVMQPAGVPEPVRRMLEVEHLAEPRRSQRPPTGDYSVMLASTTDRGSSQASADLRRVFDAWGKQILADAERAARERGAQEVMTALEEGDAVTRILECVERERADLLVVGSRGLSGLKGLFLGSVSHKLSQLAGCTCITVK